MKLCAGAMKKEGESETHSEKMAAAAVINDSDHLFAILAQAEHQHHDALVEVNDICVSRSQLKASKGNACLFTTTPGKA